MNYFLDTEFIAQDQYLDLVSIGIVAEDGRELYCENSEADLSKAGTWVKANVIPKLWAASSFKKSLVGSWTNGQGRGGYFDRKTIAREIRRFAYDDAIFWANNGAFDWTLLVQLFGTMGELPDAWTTKYIRELKMLPLAGVIPEQNPGTEHHALFDARYDKFLYSLAFS
jgi:3' exoribonuclease, RNase T-like